MHTGREGERKGGTVGESMKGRERRWNRGRDGGRDGKRKQLAID